MLKWLKIENKLVDVNQVLEKNFSDRYPVAYLKMCLAQRSWTGKPSTTQLINGTRYEYLKILTPYAENPDDMAFRIVGTKGHSELEKHAQKQKFSELQLSDNDITGICDTIERVGDKWILLDYKICGSYKAKKALGLVKSGKRPLLDEVGNPILYKTSSSKYGYKAGDIRTELIWERNRDDIDIPEWELQLNQYRILAKQAGYEINKMKIFMVIRDGNTSIARQRGINQNTYFINIKKLDDDYVKQYFSEKRTKLLTCLNNYQSDYSLKHKKYDINSDVDMGLLKKHAPVKCNNIENWNGRRCKGYCPVSEICERS